MLTKDFVFIDENNEDKESVFYADKYYEFIKALVRGFFNKSLEMNLFHKQFLNLLVSLNNYEDVYFIYSEMPFYWAMSIIENKITNETLHGEDLNKYVEFSKLFKSQNKIESFIKVV